MDNTVLNELLSLVNEISIKLESITNGSYSPKKWMRTQDVCQYLNISTSQLQVYKNEGYFSVRKLGGINFYNRMEIDEVMKNLSCEVR